ncbi:Sulfur oxidation protein SoxA [hydrothermal vent metagenome]|uniref:L-cysteine S-thiosulfotransferase subunit SoxA n=1 Tax=hydrothermal vent metagenome TaxID=652676 RepID=A0A3B0ZJG4_9ZZZZ
MKKLLMISWAAVACAIGAVPILAQASPASDLKDFRAYFFKKFPGVSLQEFSNGVYAIDKNRRLEWEAMEEFPPYEPALDIGKELFEKPFKNGKTYSSCFKNGGIGIRQNYPYFNKRTGKVKTLAAEINQCRVKNGEKKLKWKKGKLAAIIAYMSYTSRGKKVNVIVPNDSRAIAIYNRGKTSFYAKRGQLNFSCADCHVYNSGMMARSNLLSPALGHVSHFPVYRKKWEFKGKGALGGLGTIQRRYGGCNKQVRAKPFKAQSAEYTALEYFHTYMSNGIKINAPGVRQ